MMFPVVRDFINTSEKLNNDLNRASLWVNYWKMSLIPDQSKQAQEGNVSRKIKYIIHLWYLILNFNLNLQSANIKWKIFRDIFSRRAHIQTSISEKTHKANKSIGVICKLNKILHRSALLKSTVICKAPSGLWWCDLWSARKWIIQ